MIVYNKYTGAIIKKLADDQNVLTNFHHFPQEFKDSLAVIYPDEYPLDLKNYKVESEVLVPIPENERPEAIEAKLESLKPTEFDIQKAMTTIQLIEILEGGKVNE